MFLKILSVSLCCAIFSCVGNHYSALDVAESRPEPGADPNALQPPAAPGGANPNGFFGASRCANSNLQVCDGFETDPIDATLWSVVTQSPNETLSIDGQHVARGHKALHIHTPNSGYEHAVLVNRSIFPEAHNTFFGRAFIYYSGNMPQAHFSLVSAQGLLPGQKMPTAVDYGGQFGIFLANYVGDDAYQHAGVDNGGTWSAATYVPANQWMCLEWAYRGDNNEMDLWLNGNSVPRMTVVGKSMDCCADETWVAPPYGDVEIGWAIYSNADAPHINSFDVWYDEIALDSQRIGCDR